MKLFMGEGELSAQTAIAMAEHPMESATSLRQYLVYPDEAPLLRRNAAKLPLYRLLIETVDGKIWFLGVNQRAVPDRNMVEKIAAILVAPTKRELVTGAVEARLCDEAGVVAYIHDDDIEGLRNWEVEAVLNDALMAEVSRLPNMAASQLKGLRQEIRQKMEQDLSGRLARFVAALDADVVAIARPNGGLRPSSYNYLAGESATTRRNRLQAVTVFPLLLSSLAVDENYGRIRKAVNHGAPPLFDELSEFYGAPKSAVKFLARTSHFVIEENFHNKVGVLVRLIADIQPEFRPHTSAEWKRFFRTVELICKVSHCPISATGNRLWLRSCSRTRFNLPDGGPPAIDHAALAIDDLMSGIREALRCELMNVRHETDCEWAASAVIAHVSMSLSMEKLAQIGRKYGDAHRREQQVSIQERDILLGLRWVSPLQEHVQFFGLTAVSLCTPMDLIQEAARMDHCVDTYIGRCMRGESQFWSFRQWDGRPLSTLEARVERNSVVSVEHRAASNNKPNRECICAAEALIKHLRQPGAISESYWRWKNTIAKHPVDQRTMIALTRPIIAALRATLPKRMSFDTLLRMARDHAAKRLIDGSQSHAAHQHAT